jgi:GNAT superfamily N-acetyltransferase
MTREVGEAPDTFEFVVVGGGRNVAVGEKLYEAVFAPEFGADELSPPWFGDEGVVTLAALASDGTPAGGIAIWRYDCGVLLIGYIAVAPKWRRHHIASRLFEEAATRWWPPLDIGAPAHSSESAASPLVVLEVEDPRYFDDPGTRRRVRFFNSCGVKILVLDGRLFKYTQPQLAGSNSTGRVPNMLLGVTGPLAVADSRTLPTPLVAKWLREYYAAEEGELDSDPPGVHALQRARTVELIEIGRYDSVPEGMDPRNNSVGQRP